MEKNCVLTQSLTRPVYLMCQEPTLSLWKNTAHFSRALQFKRISHTVQKKSVYNKAEDEHKAYRQQLKQITPHTVGWTGVDVVVHFGGLTAAIYQQTNVSWT